MLTTYANIANSPDNFVRNGTRELHLRIVVLSFPYKVEKHIPWKNCCVILKIITVRCVCTDTLYRR